MSSGGDMPQSHCLGQKTTNLDVQAIFLTAHTLLNHLRNKLQILILLLQVGLIIFGPFFSACLITASFLHSLVIVDWSLKIQTLSASKYWSLWSVWDRLWYCKMDCHSHLLYCSERFWGILWKLGNYFLIKFLGTVAGGVVPSPSWNQTIQK